MRSLNRLHRRGAKALGAQIYPINPSVPNANCVIVLVGAALALPLDLREIGDAVHRAPNPRQQIEPGGAFRRIGIVDGNAIEKGIDRRAQSRKGRHRAFEIFVLNGGFSGRLGVVERLGQRRLGWFGRVP